MENTTEVIFRKFKDDAILALFPYMLNDFTGNVGSYMHIGQHSGANYDFMMKETKPATPIEYFNLKTELEQNFDYKFKVIKRRTYQKYLDELYRIRGI